MGNLETAPSDSKPNRRGTVRRAAATLAMLAVACVGCTIGGGSSPSASGGERPAPSSAPAAGTSKSSGEATTTTKPEEKVSPQIRQETARRVVNELLSAPKPTDKLPYTSFSFEYEQSVNLPGEPEMVVSRYQELRQTLGDAPELQTDTGTSNGELFAPQPGDTATVTRVSSEQTGVGTGDGAYVENKATFIVPEGVQVDFGAGVVTGLTFDNLLSIETNAKTAVGVTTFDLQKDGEGGLSGDGTLVSPGGDIMERPAVVDTRFGIIEDPTAVVNVHGDLATKGLAATYDALNAAYGGD